MHGGSLWRGHRHRARKTTTLLLLVAVVSGCVEPGSPPPERVLGRLGGSPPLSTSPARLDLAKTLVGSATRPAVRLASAASVEVGLPAGTEQIHFSLASQHATTPVPIRVLAQLPNGTWEVLEDVSDLRPESWHDWMIDLTTTAPSAVAIRFERRDDSSSDGADLFVGGVVASGTTAPSRWERMAHALGWGRPERRPNVVLISLDTLGQHAMLAEIEGKPVAPRLRELFAQGAHFDFALAQYPNTLVSHASLLTGLYPKRHGVYGSSPQVTVPTIAEAFAAAGYTTAAFTEDAFVGSTFGFDRGFDRYDDGNLAHALEFGGDAKETFARATTWLRQRGRAPAFVFVHTYEVHTPYTPRDAEAKQVAASFSPGYSGAYRDSYPGLLAELTHNSGKKPMPQAEIQRIHGLHLGEVNYLDRRFAEFFTELRRLLPAEDTIIVITSDHGEEFNEQGRLGHGEGLADVALHIPLAVLWPGQIAARRYDDQVESVDIAPTLAELTGVELTWDTSGRSLAGLLTGKVDRLPMRPAFAELLTGWTECKRLNEAPECVLDRVAVHYGGFKAVDSLLPHETTYFEQSADASSCNDAVPAGETTLVAEMLRDWAVEYRAMGKPPPQANQGVASDGATEERLRALGYRPGLDDSGAER